MKIQKALLIFLTLFSFSVIFGCKSSSKQICAEEKLTELGYSYEVCGRCGNISVKLENGDIVLINWNSPYVTYQNKAEEIKLKHKTVYEDGKTYVDAKLFEILGID